MGVPATSGVERTDLASMEIGDYISCEYVASSGVCGVFGNLGSAIKDEIPTTSSATPDGKFYFIKANKGLLVADRVVQHSISWDSLNSGGYIEGKAMSENLIPFMTSNTSNGIASGSTLAAGTTYDYYKAFNDNESDYTYLIADNNVCILQYSFSGSGKIVGSYEFNTVFVSDTDNRSPKTWTFEGSNDGTSWTILDTQTNVSWSQKDATYSNTQKFSFTNNDSYLHFRIKVTEFWKSNQVIAIPVFKMFSSNIIPKLIRSLSGGVAYLDENGNPSSSDKSLGAFPSINEWDTYIVNSDLGGKIIAGDDNVWHWSGMWTYCKDTPTLSSTSNAYRGGSGAIYFTYSTTSTSGTNRGFRPVLQLQNPSQTTLWY